MKQSAFCLLLLQLLTITTTTINAESPKFHVIKQWKYINFTWPSPEVLQTAQQTGAYIPQNVIISGIKYFDDFYYVTLPRMKKGVPATLARFSASQLDASPALEAFPSWAMNDAERDCENLQSVQNVEIDKNGQLWILDGGRVETLSNSIGNCQPKLLVFDIKRNTTPTIYNFPENIASKNGSFLYDLVLDEAESTYAYITDNSAHDPGIIVFSLSHLTSWKFRNASSFKADPAATIINVNGISIESPINIAGIALGPKVHTSDNKTIINDERQVYFSAISSRNLYSINATTLQNETLAHEVKNLDDYIKNLGLKASQSSGMIMDNQGNLYYGLLTENGIGKWNIYTSLQNEQQLIGKDDRFIEWPSSFGFDATGNLTVVVNRLNKFIFNQLNLNELNFFVLSAKVNAKSYLQDGNFNYNTSDSGSEGHSSPVPEPQPESSSNSPTLNNNSISTSSTTSTPVTTPKSAGNRFVLSFCSFIFAILLFCI